MPEVPALLVSGLWPVLDIGYTISKQRHVDEFGVFVLIGIAIGVLTTLCSGSARAVFLKDSITTGSIGVLMLVTLLFDRPLTFYLGRRFAIDGSKVQRDWWGGLWQYPSFRAVQRRRRCGGSASSARPWPAPCSPGSWARRPWWW